MSAANSSIPLSLYIHTPWCQHKCPYCDFNSHELKTALPEEKYINALLQDFQSQLPFIQGREIQTIFIGGGTPSLLSATAYTHLFKGLRELANIKKNAEITLEANPGTVEQSRFSGYRTAGINRLSIGVQSFQNDQLKTLERIHDANQATNAVRAAKASGFSNINIDLMYGLPAQSIEKGLDDLHKAIDLEPTHLSWYQLTIEPHTYFHRYPPTLPEDDQIWKLQEQGQALLKQQGFQSYEVSAYAKSNQQCQHNLNYWEFGDYIGIGAGAHGKVSDRDKNMITRRWNVKNPKDYLNAEKTFLAGEKILSPKELPLEFMINALRLQKPIPITLLSERTRVTADDISQPLKQAEQQNFLTYQNGLITLTPHGHRYLNELLVLF